MPREARLANVEYYLLAIIAQAAGDSTLTEAEIGMVKNGWKKQLEDKDIGDQNPKISEPECLLRINGLRKVSMAEIQTTAVVQNQSHRPI